MTSSDSSSAFAGYRFPREVIAVAVRWYLRYGLSYHDVEELLTDAGSRSITSPCTGAIDQHGQVIDVLLCVRRDLAAARRFFTRALRAGTIPAEVTTDRARAYPRVLDELIPQPCTPWSARE